MNPSVIRQWLRGGEIDQLEQVVLEGQGHKLVGEYAPDPRVRAFLKQVPDYMTRIGELNDAVNRGNLKQLQRLAPTEDEVIMKNVMLCKDHAGVGLLHKAVYNDHPEIVKWLVKKYPQTVALKDRDGKTALHYCGVCGNRDGMWNILVDGGADATVMDARGRTAAYYMEKPGEIQLPEPKLPSPALKRFTSGKNGLVVKPSNIRIWIHDRDIGHLQQVLWEGHGAKLRVETSNNPRVKRFLDAVPYMMNVIKDVHTAAINDDLTEFVKKSSDPNPIDILNSKDINGLTPLHKAAGLGHLRIVKDIVERNPKTVFTTDLEGRTALHYAKNESIFNCLIDHGSDETVFDHNGKLPSYFRANPKEIPHKLLEVVPEAPRTSLAFPPSWDWNVLNSSDALDPRYMSQGLNKFGNYTNDDDSHIDIWRNDLHADNDDDHVPTAVPIQQIAAVLDRKKDNKKDEEQRIKAEQDAKKLEQERIQNEIAEKKRIEEMERAKWEEIDRRAIEEERKIAEEEMARELAEDLDRREIELERKIAEEEMFKELAVGNNKKMTEEERKMSEEEMERELGEERQRLLDEGLLPKEDSEDEDDSDPDRNEISKLVRAGDLEVLANVVLEGDGKRLLSHRSSNPEVQNFLDNVPTYMTKIEAVHKAARDGELRSMQAALDRRRFAIAKDTAQKVTPLHVATIFGKTPIIKYLGGRFPETLRATDKNGRTALHYAASIADNGHYFNMLVNLGADRKIKDNFGNTPQYYLDNRNELTQESLLKDLSVPNLLAREMLSDKVPNDNSSSRRGLQDVEILNMLDRCMDIIDGARKRDSTLPLVKHLTRDRFEILKQRLTKHDHSLLDVIWPGIRVVQENNEDDDEYEECGGVIAPDFETYIVFQDLLKPMIKDMHGLGEEIHLHPGPKFFKKDTSFHDKDIKAVMKTTENGGIIAPDSESYQVYKEVIDPIVKDIHGINSSSDLPKHPESEFHNKAKYKVTRTQILRDAMRQKKSEEAIKKVEDDEKNKEKINKRSKQVNILVVDHENDNDNDDVVDDSPLIEIMDLDPGGKYVLAAKVECSRNLDQFYLPKCLPGDELELVENKLQNALRYQGLIGTKKLAVDGGEIQGFKSEQDNYYSVHDILTGSSAIRTKMAANDLLIPLAETTGEVHSRIIHGREWPDYRGVHLSLPCLAAWINVQEHLRVVSTSRIETPGNIGEPYCRIALLLSALDRHIPPKRDPSLGFLTSRPSCLGNTIRLEVTIRLPRLTREYVEEICESSNLTVDATELGDTVYKIKNRQSLGLTEYETYHNFTSTISSIVGAERNIAGEKSKHVSTMLKNMFNKRFKKDSVKI